MRIIVICFLLNGRRSRQLNLILMIMTTLAETEWAERETGRISKCAPELGTSQNTRAEEQRKRREREKNDGFQEEITERNLCLALGYKRILIIIITMSTNAYSKCNFNRQRAEQLIVCFNLSLYSEIWNGGEGVAEARTIRSCSDPLLRCPCSQFHRIACWSSIRVAQLETGRERERETGTCESVWS